MPTDLNEALGHHQRGNLDQARRLYEQAIAEDPASHFAYYLLGMVALQQRAATSAIDLIGRAISIRPGVGDYHAGIAEAYSAQGQHERAAASGREAIRLDPTNWQTRSNLGSTLLTLGHVEPAITLFRGAIRLKPDSAHAHNNLGKALHIQGNFEAAVHHFREAVRFGPTLVDAVSNLGKILLERGDLAGALLHCQEAVKLQTESADAQMKLGNVYQVMGRLVEAEACFRKAVTLSPQWGVTHACLGGILEHLGELDQALASFREALRLEPRHAGVLAKLATRLKDKLPIDNQTAIEQILAQPGLEAERRFPLLFGLAQVFDARGEFETAARFSIEANARQLAYFEERGLRYDAAARSNDIRQLIETFTPEFFERIRGWGLPTERPIFIVGMPRSGTSLVEQILASHPRIFGAGELSLASDLFLAHLAEARAGTVQATFDRLDRAKLRSLAERYQEGLEAHDIAKDRIIDKMPENTLFLGLIAACFPKARVIYCRRDSRDTALSCWMTQFGQLRWSCQASQIAARILETGRIMEHWRRVLPVPILDVVYEEIVDDLESKARELVSFAGLDWDPACLDFHKTRRHVRTASVLQVRQPIYRGSVDRWKNYEKPLAFLFQKLDEQGSTQ